MVMNNWSLILAFDTQDPEFARGFEAGRIWTLMTENPDALTGLIFHAENSEMILRMIEVKGLSLKAHFTDDKEWMRLDDA